MTSNGRIVLIDIRTTELTLKQMIDRIAEYNEDPRYADYDISMDGDLYAFVAEPKRRVGRRSL